MPFQPPQPPLPMPPPSLVPVFGHDQWGHGLSGGFKGDVENLDYLIKDLKQLIRAQRQVYPEVPFFILGMFPPKMAGNLPSVDRSAWGRGKERGRGTMMQRSAHMYRFWWDPQGLCLCC